MSVAAVLAGELPWWVQEGACPQALCDLPDGVVQVCCTSPPYFALRKYDGVEPSDWPAIEYAPMPGLPPLSVPAMTCCLGNEPTPEAYVGHLVLIFREVFRVLRPDGTCWLNLGDSYNADGRKGRKSMGQGKNNGYSAWANKTATGTKPKDLIGVPHRVAFALQAEGWYWRQTISWQKTSPMPSPTRDRPTSATEEIFLLAKNARYYYDLDACRVASAEATINRDRYSRILDDPDEQYAARHDHETPSHEGGRNLWNWWDVGEDENGEMPAKLKWEISTEPAKRKTKHYASYPSVIAERAFKLGTSARGACPACGSPWRRATARPCKQCGQPVPTQGKQCGSCGFRNKAWKEGRGGDASQRAGESDTVGPLVARFPGGFSNTQQALSWQPSCSCGLQETVPCLTLDPFCGTGTSGKAARSLGLRFVGVEPSASYAEAARQRISGTAPLADFADSSRAIAQSQPSLFGDPDLG